MPDGVFGGCRLTNDYGLRGTQVNTDFCFCAEKFGQPANCFHSLIMGAVDSI